MKKLIWILLFLTVMIVACARNDSPSTDDPPAATNVATSLEDPTAVPATSTETAVPPTATVPATETAVPPTATIPPPTATVVLPTATSEPRPFNIDELIGVWHVIDDAFYIQFKADNTYALTVLQDDEMFPTDSGSFELAGGTVKLTTVGTESFCQEGDRSINNTTLTADGKMRMTEQSETCSQRSSPTPTIYLQKVNPATEAVKQIVRRFNANLNNKTFFFLSLLAKDYVRHSQATPDLQIDSQEAFRAFVEQDAVTFSDNMLTTHVLIAEGDLVAVYGTWSGTQTGPMEPFPASDRVMTIDLIGFHRFEDGKIAETWVEWDNVAGLTQLGHLPEPEDGFPLLSELVPTYPAPELIATDASIEANKQLVRQFVAALNDNDYDSLRQILTEDLARYSQATPDLRVRSAEEFIEFDQADGESFPDAIITLDMIVAEGDLVATMATFSGTNSGPLGPMEPTGKEVSLRFPSVFRIENGRIAELWLTWDNLGLLSQLGLFP